MMRQIILISLPVLLASVSSAFAEQKTEHEPWDPYPVWEERAVANPNPDSSSAKAMGDRQDRPNILWLTCEDISPYLGCYGFEQALTPNLDKLAANGVRYTRAYAATTVCAVARSSILTGMFSPTIGTHGMRARTVVPEAIKAYPALFKQAGYFCTNHIKTDYNCQPYSGLAGVMWDQRGMPLSPIHSAHWKNRPKGKPFFSVFNYGATHESQLRILDKKIQRGELPPEPRIPLDEVKLPAYHPDLPEIRHDWARFHELITMMDKKQGELIQEVIDAGLWDDTIVVFYSDHGGVLARSKRFIYNSGTQVPLIVRVPEKWQHLAPGKPGTVNDEFVQFVDLPKTMLDICGIEVPEVMQGRIFMGPNTEPAPKTMICYRDRQPTRFDCSRAATDGEHYLIRNFYPHRPRGRDGRYGPENQANWGAWEAWYDANPEAAGPVYSQFYKPKPIIELFDMQQDPDQVKNLADHSALRDKRDKLSAELDAWMIKNRDLGVVPESMLFEMTGYGKKYATLYEYGQSEDYPVETILAAAKMASAGGPDKVSTYLDYLQDREPAVRFWGAYALFYHRIHQPEVEAALKTMIQHDEFATNRIMAAQALAWCGDSDAAFEAIMNEVKPDEVNAH
ncbi:MAG: sulfatase-like hydrolase/transferase, partial [Coraliomargarita sp.]